MTIDFCSEIQIHKTFFCSPGFLTSKELGEFGGCANGGIPRCASWNPTVGRWKKNRVNMKQLQHLPASSGTHPHCTGSWRMKAAVEGACITHSYGPVIRCNMSNWIVSVGNSGITLVLTFQKKKRDVHMISPQKNLFNPKLCPMFLSFPKHRFCCVPPFPSSLWGCLFSLSQWTLKKVWTLFSLLNM